MEQKTKLLIATGVGLVLSDIMPTPADAVYFKLEEKWKNQLEDGVIDAKQYWRKNALAYYGLNPIWWSMVLGSTLLFGKTFEQKLGIFAVLLSGGAIFGVLNKNIKQDTERYGTN